MPPSEQDPKATTAPATTTEQTTEQSSPKFMTAEEFNGAMTARERRFEQRIEKLIEKSFASKQSATVAAEVTGDEEAATTQEPADAKKPSGSDLAFKRATAKIEALHRQMQAKDEATAKEKAELLQRQERSDTMTALSAIGVTTAKGAYAVLKDEGRIKRNDAGELVMVVTREYGPDEVKLEAGIKEWLGTEDGKHFALPRGGGEGSGTVIRGGAQRGGGTMSKEEAKKEAQKTLSNFILNR